METLRKQQDFFFDDLVFTNAGGYLPQQFFHQIRSALLEVVLRLILLIINIGEILTEDIVRQLGTHSFDGRLGEKSGFDGVEIHACHNYLISQFYNRLVNGRADAYGKQPSLFALEIIREIRRRVPESFVIGVRLGAFEPTLEDSIAYAEELAGNGVDFLDISYGFEQRSRPISPEDYPFSDRIYAAQEIRKRVSVPVFAVGEIASMEKAEEILQATGVDMVDVGRGMLVNPNWANDAKAERDMGSCLHCKTCMWRVDAGKCPGRRAFQKKTAALPPEKF